MRSAKRRIHPPVRPRRRRRLRYSDQEKVALDEVLLDRTKHYAFPIVSGMDFGHTAPQLTVPLGCRARIDTTAEAVVVLDAAVA
jgi:muramoyltetrapeptide carboxypeptidase LdcA involved in peptidoglycan recycling